MSNVVNKIFCLAEGKNLIKERKEQKITDVLELPFPPFLILIPLFTSNKCSQLEKTQTHAHTLIHTFLSSKK